MPALPNAPQALRVKQQGTYLTTTWVNIYYLTYAATTPADADLISIAGSLRTVWGSWLGLMVSTSVTLTQTEVWDVSRNPGAYGLNNVPLAATGAVGTGPANVSVVVSKKVARRYRGGHPRLYLPGIAPSISTDGRTILPATLTVFNNNVNSWFNAVNAITTASTGLCHLANVGYYYTPVKNQPPVLRVTPIVEPIVGCVVNNRLDTQRGRLH